ncbi:SPOR domain-containing protein [Marinicella litoralis]|uniref:Cell division septation protein DedD n=1 Tax=Marinicella litoralis TaxID=644220 RepID=A0A4R6XC65_9GAMM|nr:SPOR domain-containing protein [Marinicella litoralis]TDR16842.1 cell division septation protein DedD [Marinicella litoralis]
MDQELKQRMIGASVIIALAVIFVPMLFDGDVVEKHNKNISINIPDETQNNLEVKKFALDKPVTEAVKLPANEVDLVIEDKKPILLPKPQDEQTQQPTLIQAEKNDSTVATNSNTTNQDKEITISEPATMPPENKVKVEVVEAKDNKPNVDNVMIKRPSVNNTLAQSYRVKLGSFSQQANAEKVKSSLLQNNINAIVEYNPGLKLYRVWSEQMYRTEASANDYVNAVNKLKLNIGTPKVVTLTASDVDLMASQGQLGWVIQLGSFSEKSNAIELRNKVSAAGFRGFVDVIVNSQGKSFYRLRVGPLMEKIDAEKTKSEIQSKLKLDGLIKNHELSRIVN